MKNIKDVSSWEWQNDWTTGTREKKWLSDGKLKYLFKEPKIFGELYAEVAAYQVGTIIFQLNVPKTEFAVRNGSYGVISKNFIDTQVNDNFVESVDFFPGEFDKYNLLDYKIEDALAFVSRYNLLEDFFNMCIFDYLIANQDRHSENWGLIFKADGDVCFAPLYDNGSSLLNGISEPDIVKMSKDFRMFQAFTDRAKSIFSIDDKKRQKCAYFIKYLIAYDKKMFANAFARFQGHSHDAILNALNSIDGFFMTEDRKKLVVELILHRVKIIEVLIEE